MPAVTTAPQVRTARPSGGCQERSREPGKAAIDDEFLIKTQRLNSLNSNLESKKGVF
jgi:hypothetical protein